MFNNLGTGIGYIVAEDTVTETIDNPTKVWDTGQAHYLKMYKVGDVLNIQFTDSTLFSISTTYNSVLDIISQNSI